MEFERVERLARGVTSPELDEITTRAWTALVEVADRLSEYRGVVDEFYATTRRRPRGRPGRPEAAK